MNKKQLIVMWVAIALIFMCILSHPNYIMFDSEPSYSFLFTSRYRLDFTKLLLECAGILVISGGAFVTIGRVK